MPFPGVVGLLEEIVEVLAGPEGMVIADFKAAATHVERHRVGGVGLHPPQDPRMETDREL